MGVRCFVLDERNSKRELGAKYLVTKRRAFAGLPGPSPYSAPHQAVFQSPDLARNRRSPQALPS